MCTLLNAFTFVFQNQLNKKKADQMFITFLFFFLSTVEQMALSETGLGEFYTLTFILFYMLLQQANKFKKSNWYSVLNFLNSLSIPPAREIFSVYLQRSFSLFCFNEYRWNFVFPSAAIEENYRKKNITTKYITLNNSSCVCSVSS